jgi:hypothetical protein
LNLGNTQQYKAAIAALTAVQQQLGGTTPELQAIAAYLFYTNQVDAPTPKFPFVGMNDSRDIAAVQAWESAWERLISDEDDLD